MNRVEVGVIAAGIPDEVDGWQATISLALSREAAITSRHTRIPRDLDEIEIEPEVTDESISPVIEASGRSRLRAVTDD